MHTTSHGAIIQTESGLLRLLVAWAIWGKASVPEPVLLVMWLLNPYRRTWARFDENHRDLAKSKNHEMCLRDWIVGVNHDC